ncbi:MAG: hypothetical protein CMA79_01605, partial [Euryarchaeota archaeon]|nr:hypothetical protein [Euryarchaeota archaeon]
NAPLRRFLRKPPGWAFAVARLLMPSRTLRRALLDPIRRKGWKHVPADKPQLGPDFEELVREYLRDDIGFFENISTELPDGVVL